MNLKKLGVENYVRFCEKVTYSPSDFEGSNLNLNAWPFPDGDLPSIEVITQWLKLIDHTFADKSSVKATTANTSSSIHHNNDIIPAIGCHCLAGLGRAPVMVAIALIENGLNWADAVDVIREKRCVLYHIKHTTDYTGAIVIVS